MTLTRQDDTLTWTEQGPAPLRGTVVLLPGRGESPQVYERFGRRLAADAYRVHVVTAPTESLDQAQEQVVALVGAADSGTPRVVVGSDSGAAHAAYLAARARPDGVAALVLAGLPTGTAGPPAGGWDAELELRTSCPAHRARISRAGVRPAQLFAEIPRGWLDPAIPGRIDVPVLGIHGRADAVSPLDIARSWYARVPRAELVSVAGGHHDVLNDVAHRTVAATVVLFLERLRSGSDLTPIAVTESPSGPQSR